MTDTAADTEPDSTDDEAATSESDDNSPDWRAGAITNEINDGGGRQIAAKPAPLEEFEYGFDDAFVRWHPWGDERAGEDVWAVTNISWEFKRTWITKRDDVPTLADHRVYTLLSRETFDEVSVSEEELQRGEWKHVDEVDDVEL